MAESAAVPGQEKNNKKFHRATERYSYVFPAVLLLLGLAILLVLGVFLQTSRDCDCRLVSGTSEEALTGSAPPDGRGRDRLGVP